jgi:hypothetical protein
MTDGYLFPELVPIVKPEGPPPPTLEERFAAFHSANPQVYSALVALARELVQAGVTHCGIGQLTERLRWEAAIRTRGDEYRINNSFRALYARLLVERERWLPEGFFELRRRRADRPRRRAA